MTNPNNWLSKMSADVNEAWRQKAREFLYVNRPDLTATVARFTDDVLNEIVTQFAIDNDVYDYPRRPNGHNGHSFEGYTQDKEGLRENPPRREAVIILFKPTPFSWKNPADIKPRDWLYAKHYIRKFVSCTIGRRGHGKTTRTIAEILSMVTGRDILKTGQMPGGKLRVWYIGEDPRDEIERRIMAACVHYGITQEEIGDRLFFDSVLDIKRGSAKVAKLIKGTVTANEDGIKSLKAGIDAHKVDVLILDPLKKFHGVAENSNDQMDEVMEIFSEIAMEKNVSIEILLHTRKPSQGNGSAPMTADDARGADAIIAAARSARVITIMTTAEAPALGIEEKDAWRYNRLDDGKANMKPPGEATWTQLWSEVLPCGESVGVLKPWKKPEQLYQLEQPILRLIYDWSGTGAYRSDSRSPEWLGWKLAKHLEMKCFHGGDNRKCDLARLNGVLKKCRSDNILEVETRIDEKRRPREYFIQGSKQPPSENTFNGATNGDH